MEENSEHNTKAKHKYTPQNPQPAPSPLLAEYMRKQNIDKAMTVEDARKWFYGLRDALRPFSREEIKFGK